MIGGDGIVSLDLTSNVSGMFLTSVSGALSTGAGCNESAGWASATAGMLAAKMLSAGTLAVESVDSSLFETSEVCSVAWRLSMDVIAFSAVESAGFSALLTMVAESAGVAISGACTVGWLATLGAFCAKILDIARDITMKKFF